MTNSPVLDLAKALISCPSVTPVTAGVFDVIENFLTPLGFVATRATFEEPGTAPVENLYLRYGSNSPNFCFAGHTDVVPVGDEAAWQVPPFAPQVVDGELIGRGAEDMKGAIAAFMVAAREFLQRRQLSESGDAGAPLPAGEAGLLSDAKQRFSNPGEGASEQAHAQLRPHPDLHQSPGGNWTNPTSPAGRGVLAAPPAANFSISLLITQDEEGIAVNGTRKMLEFLKARGEVIDACIVGEPTNPNTLGEMAKIGRRGSISFTLEVQGKQGHAAYPALADNPVTRIVNMLHALKAEPLDAGNAHFQPSNLEVTTVDVGNPTVNMIPAKATAQFNVRFNNLHMSRDIIAWVEKHIAPFGAYELKHRLTGESFLTQNDRLASIVTESVKEITGLTPALSTTGGTSDARFIKDYCPVIEFGTTGRTSHMVNERVEVKTLEGLAKIYQRMLEKFFQ